MEREKIKSGLESMLFVWGDPLSISDAAKVFGEAEAEVMACMRELQDEYDARDSGLQIQKFGNNFQLCTREENREFIEKLCNPVKERKLSRSALEVLAIIAYKQPVTRGEIESIRGVKCTYVVEGLVQKGLIEEVGRSEAIGRPVLFGTTDLFLRHFGIESLVDLPDLETDEGNTSKEV